MKMENPFSHKKSVKDSVTEKVSSAIHLPGQRTKQDKYIHWLQQSFLYVAIFLAGYIVAMVQYVL